MTSNPQNTETAMSGTATATVGSAHDETHRSSDWNPALSPNTLQATAGRTPPMRPRLSSSTPKDSKSSKKKKPASKNAKQGSTPARARDSQTSVSKVSGSRSVDAKKAKPPASLPEAPSAVPRKIEQAQIAHTLSPGGTSESLVSISKDTGSTDEPLSPFGKKRDLRLSSSKRPNAPEKLASAAAKTKQGTTPPSPKQMSSSSAVPQNKKDERQSGLVSAEISRSTTKSLKKTSKTLAVTTPEMSRTRCSVPAATRTPKRGPRKGSDVDSSHLLDVLVGNMRDITCDGGGAESSVEDSAVASLPFSSCTGSALTPRSSAPPAAPVLPAAPAATRDVPASFRPPARPAALDKGCDLFEFAFAAGTGSLLLVALLYLLKGYRSHVLACSDHQNCTTLNVSYPPHT